MACFIGCGAACACICVYVYVCVSTLPCTGDGGFRVIQVSVHLIRKKDDSDIPYVTVHGVTLITMMRLGLLRPLVKRAYHQFVSLPLYEDMAPWNIVFLGVRCVNPGGSRCGDLQWCGSIARGMQLTSCVRVCVRACGEAAVSRLHRLRYTGPHLR